MEAVDTPVFMDVKPCKLILASMVFVPLPECLYHAVRQGVGRLRMVKDAEQAPGEPPRDYRRPFGLSYAAMETSSSMA